MKKIVGILMAMCAMVMFGATSTEKTDVSKAAKAEKQAEAQNERVRKSGKKLMHEKRDELYDSLEERVFRAPGNGAAHEAAVNDSFRAGKQRLQFLLAEEQNITEIEKLLGNEDTEHYFLNDKYDEVVNQYKEAKTESDMLAVEHKKLTEYLGRLEKMKARVNGSSK